MAKPKATHLAIARIVASYGVRGEVKANVLTDFPERFRHLKAVFVGDKLIRYDVLSARVRRGQVYLRLAGCETVEAAEKLRGQLVQVPVEEAHPLPEDHYYWHQILDLEVVTDQGEHLGRIVDILDLPANDVYVVEGPYGEVLVPAIEDVVVEVDPARGRMVIKLLPGMVERPEREQ